MHLFSKRLIFFTCFAILLIGQSSAIDHIDNGTDYGDEGIDLYSQMKHGQDGALFLDPYFIPYLQNLEGCTLLDAGCGAGPWSILAAKNGGIVYGIDLQEGMIAKAKEAAQEAQIGNIHFEVGDIALLPYLENFFDRTISINVGCNLPCLQPHLKELYRVLKPGGLAVITSPNSFGSIFTDGQLPHEEIRNSIKQSLIKDPSAFPQSMLGEKHLYRASFVKVSDKWTLIEDEREIKYGEPIIRRLPLMMIPNYYHPLEEYLDLFAKEDFLIKEVHTPHFFTEEDRLAYNAKNKLTLGKEYVTTSPCMIFIVEKLNR